MRWIDYEVQRDFTDWSDLCVRHNADCDAYEARITELQRRLDAVVASLEPGKPPCDCIGDYGPECYCYNSGDLREAESWWTSWCNHRRAKAIAEGRTP